MMLEYHTILAHIALHQALLSRIVSGLEELGVGVGLQATESHLLLPHQLRLIDHSINALNQVPRHLGRPS